MLPGPHPVRRHVVALLGVLLGTALLLSGCGAADKKDEPEAKSPTGVMTQAKKLFDDASSVHIELATGSTPPSGANGVLGASGDITHDPAFKGDVKVLLSGLTATVPVTSVDGKVYAKLPLSTGYATIKPSEYGAPDPADFADPDKGLSSLLTQMDGLKKGKQTRSGDQILTTYTGTLPGAAVKEIIPSASAKETYETAIGVDEKGYARTVKVTGVFFSAGEDVTYDVKFSDYGAGVKITAPSS
jgi:lipoprotein LprG